MAKPLQLVSDRGGLTGVFIPNRMLDLFYTAPERCGKSIKQIAEEVGGVDPKYLARQLNPHDEGAKLGVVDAIFFMSRTDWQPLKYVLELLPDEDRPAAVLKDVESEAVDVSLAIHQFIACHRQAHEDGRLTQDEKMRLLACLNGVYDELGELKRALSRDIDESYDVRAVG